MQKAEKDPEPSLNPVTQECMQKHPKDGLHHTPGAGYFNNISKYFVHTSTALPNYYLVAKILPLLLFTGATTSYQRSVCGEFSTFFAQSAFLSIFIKNRVKLRKSEAWKNIDLYDTRKQRF